MPVGNIDSMKERRLLRARGILSVLVIATLVV
ncbi:MAG: hypothetical protein ACI8QC_002236, partial [Planctomycetota bacterium]